MPLSIPVRGSWTSGGLMIGTSGRTCVPATAAVGTIRSSTSGPSIISGPARAAGRVTLRPTPRVAAAAHRPAGSTNVAVCMPVRAVGQPTRGSARGDSSALNSTTPIGASAAFSVSNNSSNTTSSSAGRTPSPTKESRMPLMFVRTAAKGSSRPAVTSATVESIEADPEPGVPAVLAVEVVRRTSAPTTAFWPSTVRPAIEEVAVLVTTPSTVVMLWLLLMRPVPSTPLGPVREASASCRATFSASRVFGRPQTAPSAVSSSRA